MTEKRFQRLSSSIDYYYCVDTKNNDKSLTEEEMLNLLNGLSEEIEELKSELETKEFRISLFKSMNASLEKENEQLKSELEDFKKFVYLFKDISDLTNWQQDYENKELKE